MKIIKTYDPNYTNQIQQDLNQTLTDKLDPTDPKNQLITLLRLNILNQKTILTKSIKSFLVN